MYDLFSRLQGCLWGLIWGEVLGLAAAQHSKPSRANNWMVWVPPAIAPTELPPWSQAVYQALMDLIHGQGWQPDRALEPFKQPLSASPPLAAWAIAALPTIVYFHDDGWKLRHSLHQVLPLFNDPDPEIGVVAYLLSQALTGATLRSQSLTEAITYLDSTPSSRPITLPPSLVALEPVQFALQDCSDRRTLYTHLQAVAPQADWTIALACYYSLSTLDSPRLALVRAAQHGCPELSALTGALVGAMATNGAFPLAWRVRQTRAIAQLTHQFLAVWAGLPQPSEEPWSAAVAAPRWLSWPAS